MPELTSEQAKAVFHNDGNILVSASAGSGKTHVMIERLIRLISEGKASVKEMLAITFTEASASDMKEKLKKALTQKINEGDEKLCSELIDVAVADISTVDAFCARLLRKYFFTVGINPDFKIADEDQAGVLKAESIEKTFKDFYAKGDTDFYKLVNRYRNHRKDENFKKYILETYSYCASEKSYENFKFKCLNNYSKQGYESLIKDYKEYMDNALSSILERFENALYGFQNNNNAKATEFCLAMINDVKYLMGGDIYKVKDYENFKRTASFGQKLDEIALGYKEIAVSASDDFKELIAEYNGVLKSREEDIKAFDELKEHTEIFFKVYEKFAENYSNLKREENLLDFGDLGYYTLIALKDQSVINAIKKQYKYVFIDEFQDVNGVQDEIANLITKDNLFMVGDLKQSIYGFRGCRAEFFIDRKEEMQSLGQTTVELNCNFRSALNVINAVNEIFSFCMTKKTANLDYKNTSALKLNETGGYPNDCKGRFELHFLKSEGENKRVYEEPRIYDIMEEVRSKSIDSECTKISSLVTKIINGELNKTYYDLKEKREKPVRFSDIAILSRTKDTKYIQDLVSGLIKHGVPVTSEVKENVCDFPEIKTLINVLKLIDGFRQDIPLVSTLKSSVGNFTEEDLSEIVLYYTDNFKPNAEKGERRGGFTDAFFYYLENAQGQLKDRVVEFYNYFNRMRYLADFLGAGGVLDRIIKDSDYENGLLCSAPTDSKIKRVHAFLSAAVSGGKPLTVREFLKKIESAKDAFLIPPTADEETVRVMTIHASKGLEFPVVIVCGLERNPNKRDESAEIIKDRDYGLAVKSYNDSEHTHGETILRKVIAHKKRQELIKEEMRLFYVATTRAEYSLHLIFEGKEDARSSTFNGGGRLLDYIPNSLPVTLHDTTDDKKDFTELLKEKRQVLIGKVDQNAKAVMEQNFAYKYPFMEDTLLPLKNSVTAAAKFKAEEFYPVHVIFDDEHSPNVESGLIAHKIMEHLDFNDTDNFNGQVKDMVIKGVLTDEMLSKINLSRIEKAVKTSALSNLKGYELFREKDFITEIEANRVFETGSVEKVLLQGVIDLLAISKNTAIIVDYKYSSLSSESLLKQYGEQLSLYAYATNKLLGVTATKKILVNLFTGETVEVK